MQMKNTETMKQRWDKHVHISITDANFSRSFCLLYSIKPTFSVGNKCFLEIIIPQNAHLPIAFPPCQGRASDRFSEQDLKAD